MFGNMLRKLAPILGLMVVVAACQPQPPRPAPTTTPLPPTQTLAPTFTPYLGPTAGPINPETQATLRFVLAVPDAPAVDIYLDDTLVITQLGFGSLSVSIPQDAGKHLVRLMPSGGVASSQTMLLEQTVELAPRQSLIGVLTGTASKLVLQRVVENTDTLDAGQVRIQIAYALGGNTPISVAVDDRPPEKLQSPGEITASVVLKADTHDFKFSVNNQPLLSQSVALIDRQVYTLILCGAANETATLVVVNSPTIGQSKLRVLNISPDLGPVDVYLGNSLLAQALDARQSTSWLSIPMTSVTLRVLKAGSAKDAAPLYQGEVALRADQSGDLIISDQPPQVRIFWENVRPTAARTARLSVLNMVRGSAPVQVMVDKTLLSALPPVGYGQMSPGIPIADGLFQPAFITSGEIAPRTVEEVTSPLPLKEGFAYLYVVTGEGRTVRPVLLVTEVGIDKLSIIPTAPSASIPRQLMQVRVINATSYEGIPVGIYVGQRMVFRELKAHQISQSFTITAMDAGDPFRVTMPTENQSRAELMITFVPGQAVTLIVVGRDLTDLRLVQAPDDVQVAPDKAQLQVIQESSRTPRASIEWLAAEKPSADTSPTATPELIPNSIKLVDQIDVHQIVNAPPMPPGKYFLLARSTEDGNPLIVTGPFDLEAGKRYELVILPDSALGQMFLIPLDGK